jgi:hypothetical protein
MYAGTRTGIHTVALKKGAMHRFLSSRTSKLRRANRPAPGQNEASAKPSVVGKGAVIV